nr:hypothetical protein [Tanacetum cinerariifolium]
MAAGKNQIEEPLILKPNLVLNVFRRVFNVNLRPFTREMIIGYAGVKNGIFILEGEKIWRNHEIREKGEKDPYNVSEERRMIILG